MPTYDYLCESCRHQFSAEQRMTETRLRDCPVCHEASLIRLISAAGFALKGNGWYKTDFKGGTQTPAAETKAVDDATAVPAAAPAAAAPTPAPAGNAESQ